MIGNGSVSSWRSFKYVLSLNFGVWLDISLACRWCPAEMLSRKVPLPPPCHSRSWAAPPQVDCSAQQCKVFWISWGNSSGARCDSEALWAHNRQWCISYVHGFVVFTHFAHVVTNCLLVLDPSMKLDYCHKNWDVDLYQDALKFVKDVVCSLLEFRLGPPVAVEIKVSTIILSLL